MLWPVLRGGAGRLYCRPVRYLTRRFGRQGPGHAPAGLRQGLGVDRLALRAVARRRLLLTLRNGWFPVALAVGVGLIVTATLSSVARTERLEEQLAALRRRDALSEAAAVRYAQVSVGMYREPARLAAISRGVGEGAGAYATVRGLYGGSTIQRVEEVEALSVPFELDPARVVAVCLGFVAVLFSHDVFNSQKRAGTARFVCSLPASRAALLAGEVVGQAAALGMILAAMFTAATAVLVATRAGGGAEFWIGWMAFWLLVLWYVGLWLGIGSALSLLVRDPPTSLAAGVFLWSLSSVLLPAQGGSGANPTMAAHPAETGASVARLNAPGARSFISPYMLFITACDRLSGTDAEEDRRFARAVRLQELALEEWQSQRALAEPARVRLYTAGDPPLDLSALPRVAWSEQPLGRRLPRLWAPLLGLALWTCSPFLVCTWRMAAWDPR